MTGLDRLRELADDVIGSVWANTSSSYCKKYGLSTSNTGGGLDDFLAAIADQIEAEQDERVTRRAEDREAAEWVREHGGLEKIKRQRMESVPREAYERKKQKLMRHISECHDALRKRKQRIEEMERCIKSRTDELAGLHDEFERVRLDHIEGIAFERIVDDIAARLGVAVAGLDSQDTRNRIMPVLDRRLMPEGMEWPRFEDGEPVRVGDEFECWCGNTEIVNSITIRDGRSVINESQSHSFVVSDGPYVAHGERVKRPAPKVLDADGEVIREGDTVWTTRDLDKFTVTDPNNGKFLCVICKGEDGEDYCCYPTDLTHRAPVLDADGKVIPPGFSTVYSIADGAKKQAHVSRFGDFEIMVSQDSGYAAEPTCFLVTKPVLAADGKPIRRGDTLYDIAGYRFEVSEEPEPGEAVIAYMIDRSGKQVLSFTKPEELSHTRPVLASDRKPLREGETVWAIDDGIRYEVCKAKVSEDGRVLVRPDYSPYDEHIDPSLLTHERPDSWERLEEDANASTCIYFGVSTKDCEDCGHVSWECSYDKARDLVRRAKKLAGVDND